MGKPQKMKIENVEALISPCSSNSSHTVKYKLPYQIIFNNSCFVILKAFWNMTRLIWLSCISSCDWVIQNKVEHSCLINNQTNIQNEAIHKKFFNSHHEIVQFQFHPTQPQNGKQLQVGWRADTMTSLHFEISTLLRDIRLLLTDHKHNWYNWMSWKLEKK